MSQKGTNENGNGLLLYLHNYSFYAQKVILALHEKKIPFKSQTIDITKGEQYQPSFLEVNPRGEVPALRDGVKVIPDSARIIDYLEDNFSNGNHPRLIPQEPSIKQRVNHFRELIDRIPANTVTMGAFYHSEFICKPKLPFIAPVRAFMRAGFEKTAERLTKLAEAMPQYRETLLNKAEDHAKTYKTVKDKEAYTRLLDEVDNTLQEVEDQLFQNKDSSSWLVCPEFTAADVSLTTLLYRLDVVGLSRKFYSAGRRPCVEAYYDRVSTRPSFQATFPTLFYHFKALIGFK
ncbi:ganglioside-induced differentiation-associated protein 1-like isoform X2 [Rhodnius prolixus]